MSASTPGSPLVMGILNVTPDSFSDGGLWSGPDAAVTHGLELMAAGAQIVDVGGESTRPGAERPPVAEELRRVLPVIEALAGHGCTVSVDTMRAEVAEEALAAGARIVNDVSGGLADPDILRVVAGSSATYVAMHWRAHSTQMQSFTDYGTSVVDGVVAELSARAEAILAAGVAPERLILDPGIGFAKTADQNWELLAGLDPVAELGFGLLVGASRKSFLGSLLADASGTPRPVDGREAAHSALIALLAARFPQLWGLRVHDVRATRDALAVVRRLADTAPEDDG